MKLKVDQEADALYLALDDSPIAECDEVAPGVVVDLNDKKEIAGVEILYLSKRTSKLNVHELQFETA
jgi:uncharacterized protein YuzE